MYDCLLVLSCYDTYICIFVLCIYIFLNNPQVVKVGRYNFPANQMDP